jgi:uncharacterized protein (DUF924 family)
MGVRRRTLDAPNETEPKLNGPDPAARHPMAGCPRVCFIKISNASLRPASMRCAAAHDAPGRSVTWRGTEGEVETPDTIHAFWFGGDPDDAQLAAGRSKLWWSKDPAVDAAMRQRFGPWLARAAARALDDWLATPVGRLALILLTDQVPRNIHRGTPRAFAFDALARHWCEEGIAAGQDEALRPLERVFFYLPLEHSESLADQERAVALFRTLAQAAPAGARKTFDGFLDYALRHREVIARFGRFPHRNRVLARASTARELVFLAEPGSSF